MMARIRTIKPEFCTSEQVVECSTNARLLFVCMFCFCDDAGRHPANTKRLKMEVFPGDSFEDSEIRSMVDELLQVGLLTEYTHENSRYWQVTGWEKHQKIDRPTYKYPPIGSDGKPAEFDEHSTSTQRTLDERSPPEWNGMESNGREGDVSTVASLSPIPGTNNAKQTQPVKQPKTEKPEDVSEETWRDWLAHRKAKKALVSQKVLDQHRNAAKQQGWALDDALLECVVRGWTGLKADWLERRKSRVVDLSDPSWMERYPQ